jgi:hypothetical protein
VFDAERNKAASDLPVLNIVSARNSYELVGILSPVAIP